MMKTLSVSCGLVAIAMFCTAVYMLSPWLFFGSGILIAAFYTLDYRLAMMTARELEEQLNPRRNT